MTVGWFATKRAFGHFSYVGWKKKQWSFSQWFWPQADTSVPKLWAPQGGDWPGIAPAPAFPDCSFVWISGHSHCPASSWRCLRTSPGPSCIFIVELPEPLPGGCGGWEDSFRCGLQVIFRVFIKALWWNLDLEAVQSGCLLAPQPSSHLVVTLFIILDFTREVFISLHLWTPFSLHPRTLQRIFRLLRRSP